MMFLALFLWHCHIVQHEDNFGPTVKMRIKAKKYLARADDIIEHIRVRSTSMSNRCQLEVVCGDRPECSEYSFFTLVAAILVLLNLTKRRST